MINTIPRNNSEVYENIDLDMIAIDVHTPKPG